MKRMQNFATATVVTALGTATIALDADAIAIKAKGEASTVTHGWPPGGDSQLARVDLATGQATPFGALNKPANFMGLGFAPDGTLYGVNAGSGTPDAGSLYQFDLATGAATEVGGTGAAAVTLTGSADSRGRALAGLTWTNLTGRTGGTVTGTTAWQVRPVLLVPDKTKVIVMTAAMPATWIPGQAAATTFSDTLSVFSTPVRLSLTRQGGEAVLGWTGGVPPFAVQRAATVDGPWTEAVSHISPPVTVPVPGPTHFYRVMGR